MEVPKQAPEFELIPHTRTREAITDRITRSRREIPHFDLFAQADVSALVGYRESRKVGAGLRPGPSRRADQEIAGRIRRSAPTNGGGGDWAPTFNDLFIYIIARLLPEFPRLNAWYAPEGVQQLKPVHMGFAVQTDQGVLLPTLYDANRKPLRQISEEAHELTTLARAGRLRASFQQWAGFTISNVGPVGIDAFNAIISPPQTGILAIGPIAPRPLVVNGELAVRPTAWLALTVDHRVVDGAVAAGFLAAVKARLESFADEEH